MCSTETVCLMLQNNVLMAVDTKGAALLIHLDLFVNSVFLSTEHYLLQRFLNLLSRKAQALFPEIGRDTLHQLVLLLENMV